MRWLVVCALLVPRAAQAEINLADSVEWMSADSDLVVRGVVTSVRVVKVKGKVVWHRAILRVNETLKGTRHSLVSFGMPHRRLATASQWKRDGTEVLLYLVESKRRVKDDRRFGLEPFAPRRNGGSSRSMVALTGARIGPVFTMGFQVHRDRASILAAARRAAVVKGGHKSTHIDVPFRSPAHGALWAGSSVWLNVPIDARLARFARLEIKAADVHRRARGVGALSHFRSARHIRLLRGLLTDPGSWTEHQGTQRTRVFGVRRAAHRVLSRWGVKVKKPTIRQPIP